MCTLEQLLGEWGAHHYIYIYRVSREKNPFQFSRLQTVLTFLIYILNRFSFSDQYFQTFWHTVLNFAVHFVRWSSLYWNTSVRTWPAKMTFLEDQYLGIWLLWTNIFSEWLPQNLCSTTPTFAGIEKKILKTDNFFTVLERRF